MPRVTVLCLAAGCTAPLPGAPVVATDVHTDVVQTFVDHLTGTDAPSSGVERVALGAAHDGAGVRIEVLDDQDCTECYWLELSGDSWTPAGITGITVHGGGVLGVQYGLAHALELLGVRFFHPWRPHLPPDWSLEAAALERTEDDPEWWGTESDPVIPETGRRGLHLHTLHPIEGLRAFWTPDGYGDQTLDRAARVADWVVKNRGNHLQWVALDDISEGSQAQATHAEWEQHTAAVLDEVHRRGLTAGLGVQQFGGANLQQAFDLTDESGTIDEITPSVEARMALLTDQLDFDLFNLSFGEFFAEDPETLIAAIDNSYAVLQDQQPGAEMTTVIHVGDDLQVEYDGQTMPYYFLATYADPAVVPWVHTVMYYNLIEDAGGAYHHDEFDDHRQLLTNRLVDGEPVGYFPESAYWVAFDNPVPQYLPLYVRSRWLDLDHLRDLSIVADVPRLDDHVLFSTGWEWGYWQGDAATLRFTHTLPNESQGGWESIFHHWYDGLAPVGPQVADVLIAFTTLQQVAHIEQRLAGYLAGRDAVMEGGYLLGIVSQPERHTFADVVDAEVDADAFEDEVVVPLGELAEASEAFAAQLDVLVAPYTSVRWLAEVRDGVRIDALRARFAHSVWAAAVAGARGEDTAAALETADQAWDAARPVVDRRHADLHDTQGAELIAEDFPNPTIYDYGYLVRAQELCFWERERVELANALGEDAGTPPNCAL